MSRELIKEAIRRTYINIAHSDTTHDCKIDLVNAIKDSMLVVELTCSGLQRRAKSLFEIG